LHTVWYSPKLLSSSGEKEILRRPIFFCQINLVRCGVLMEAAIEAQLKKQGLPPQQVTVLILDKCVASKVSGLGGFAELAKLSINNSGLTTLENFPNLPKLTKVNIIKIIYPDWIVKLNDASARAQR
jgi:hypothetical protein